MQSAKGLNTKFVVDITAWVARAKGDLNKAVSVIVWKMAKRIIERSPVDTGRFRANWQYTVGTPASGDSDSTDWAGNTAALKAEISNAKYGNVHYITNNLPYAVVLEYGLYPNPPKRPTGKTVGGFSTQAPNGMVRVTIEEFQTIFGETIREVRSGTETG